MPAKIFLVTNRANKEVIKLPLWVQKKIDQAFDQLKENPIAGTKLHGELVDYFKFRIGDYRIIYKFDSRESSLEIIRIEHRQGVYK